MSRPGLLWSQLMATRNPTQCMDILHMFWDDRECPLIQIFRQIMLKMKMLFLFYTRFSFQIFCNIFPPARPDPGPGDSPANSPNGAQIENTFNSLKNKLTSRLLPHK